MARGDAPHIATPLDWLAQSTGGAPQNTSGSSSLRGRDVLIMIGPEGGWSPREQAAFTALSRLWFPPPPRAQPAVAGASAEVAPPPHPPSAAPLLQRLCLSRSTILRAETAAMVACSYAQLAGMQAEAQTQAQQPPPPPPPLR